MDIPATILTAYGFDERSVEIETLRGGLINSTWKLSAGPHSYILQRINDQVFREPRDIATNMELIAHHLAIHHPSYTFVDALPSVNGDKLIAPQEGVAGYFRLFPFVAGSHAKEVVQTPGQAYEAARQFGRFTRLLTGLDVQQLKITLPSFHDLSLRYAQFMTALRNGNRERIATSLALITTIKRHAGIVDSFEKMKTDPDFKMRVTHHDTKISNVLFNDSDQGICVIDLDTVMPGYFISDVGDMMRTYLSPVSEEEPDLTKIKVREEFYKAIVNGYSIEMEDEMSATEKKYFFHAGQFMIYMQALRFLTDHLNDDAYYGAKYPGHNFVRAGNQAVLLERLIEKEAVLNAL